ncbi:hypothetical protein [Pseudoclavibacter sp. AY1H1]|uniref:hypothetical protein n=1 Tax=Pseudoclavibacter sp. AY1H1 TaxID=2080584 RepID=UPI000CE7EC30|nr:hypothetical protein [Pseudoclavibacter sp. AY1H1]PPF32658.1 hypothetical protein C5E05_19325 [Pseudoclavibacter sp. AY1H1]
MGDSFTLAAAAAILAFLLVDVAVSVTVRIGISEVFAYLALGVPVLLLVGGAICEAAQLWCMARRKKNGHRG